MIGVSEWVLCRCGWLGSWGEWVLCGCCVCVSGWVVGVSEWVLCGCGCAMLTQLTSLCVQVSMLKGRTQSGAVFVHCQAITHERSMTLHGKPSHTCTAAVHTSRH